MHNQEPTINATLRPKIEKYDVAGQHVETVEMDPIPVTITLSDWTAQGGLKEDFDQALKEQGGN